MDSDLGPGSALGPAVFGTFARMFAPRDRLGELTTTQCVKYVRDFQELAEHGARS